MLLMAMTLSLVTVSCSDDEEEEPAPAQTQNGTNSIVGTWSQSNEWGTDTYIFNADGTYVNTWTEKDKGSDSDYGTYSLSGNRLVMTSSTDGFTESFTVTISGSTLTLASDYGWSETYTRAN